VTRDEGVLDASKKGRSGRSIRFASPAAIAGSLLLLSCVGVIQRIELDPTTHMVCDSTNTVCGVPAGAQVTYKIWGKGQCDIVGVTFGDGASEACSPSDFGDGSVACLARHTYSPLGWGGGKTVRAYSVRNCAGEVSMQHNVLRPHGSGFVPDFTLGIFFSPADPFVGWALPVRPPCPEVPSVDAPIRVGTKVFLRPAGTTRVDFGCWFGGCIYNADGELGSAAPSNFPFPGFRKYSLLMRVGNQTVQGGTFESFTATQSGPLEACVNDDNLLDNSGAWGVDILVDETRAEYVPLTAP